jgi:hypothetical protein
MEPLVEEKAGFRQEVAEFRRVKKRLPRRVEELERRVQELLYALEEPQRAGKRQAAPFSRRWPKAHPAKAGRKARPNYGCRCHRPLAAGIDETLEAELPGCCPRCGREVAETKMERQYQTEIPRPGWNRSSLVFMWVVASAAAGGCRAGIHARPRMRWAVRRRNWERGRWRWPGN